MLYVSPLKALAVDVERNLRAPLAGIRRLIDLFTGWDSRFTALIAACDDPVLPRSITTLPVGLTWPSTPDVTLLGDAAHLMPPVGQAATMALLDGALLGLALAAHPDDFPAAVKEYERETFERTNAAGRQSAHVQEILTSPDASQKMLALFQPGRYLADVRSWLDSLGVLLKVARVAGCMGLNDHPLQRSLLVLRITGDAMHGEGDRAYVCMIWRSGRPWSLISFVITRKPARRVAIIRRFRPWPALPGRRSPAARLRQRLCSAVCSMRPPVMRRCVS
ncbi:hypothetical protein [Actinomadura sp. HBU206391]|uniref:hypothetical protein n=1 Tax=Actinomadura sp. HBU206391 TaxID=2731692 RepID=UPI001C9D5ABE|nr:hypothetical protein [Actinomadura sp. HBU206391]